MKRDFTKLLDISSGEGAYLIERAGELKGMAAGRQEFKPLQDRCLAMIFEKASTRTRISFEVGIRQLGGYGIFLSPSETQIGRGEPIRDTARVLSRYVDAIMIRTFSQEAVDELARWATVPVINGLTDLYHPCQILSDLFTIVEFKGDFRKLRIAYIGDGNNIANSWIEAAILFGFTLALATPDNYKPKAPVFKKALSLGRVEHTSDPHRASAGADVINTDVWVSMGQEEERQEREAAFASYRVDGNLLKAARDGAIVMHCLPAYRNKEISEDVFEQFEEVLFTQAENRLHMQKALMEWLMKGERSATEKMSKSGE